MSNVEKTRAIWSMKPGDTIPIDAKSTGRFRKACERCEKKKPLVFFIEKIDNETSKVKCYDDFDAPEKPHATKRRHMLHFVKTGGVMYVPFDMEASWRSVARYIEQKTPKRFIFKRDALGLKVMRLPDGADKASYKVTGAEKHFNQMEADETVFYPSNLKLEKISEAVIRHEAETGFGFDIEWIENGLNVTRLW